MDWLPDPRDDELVYSILARLFSYLGEPTAAAFSRAICGGRHWVAQTQFPCQLDALAERFGLDGDGVDRLIDHHSVLRFYTAFAGQQVREHARSSMRRSADGLYLLLGIGSSKIPPPRQLRFCPICFREMREARGDAWWRRIHQLPGIVVCAVHGEPLRNSLIDWSRLGRHALVAPDPDVCREDAALAFPGPRPARTQDRLLDLARAAQRLLVAPPPPMKPDELYRHYHRRLAACGLKRGTRHIRYAALCQLVRDHWGDALEVVRGLQVENSGEEGWLLDLVRNRRRLAHPLRHLVLDLALLEMAPVEQPFGAGPWPCLNPIERHFQHRVIGSHRQVRDKGKLHGHFICECGYSYSLTKQQDGTIGRPRFRTFGPTLAPYVLRALREGRSLRGICAALRLDPKTLMYQAALQGIAMPWRSRPSGRVAATPSIASDSADEQAWVAAP